MRVVRAQGAAAVRLTDRATAASIADCEGRGRQRPLSPTARAGGDQRRLTCGPARDAREEVEPWLVRYPTEILDIGWSFVCAPVLRMCDFGSRPVRPRGKLQSTRRMASRDPARYVGAMGWEHDRFEARCEECGHSGVVDISSDDWGRSARRYEGFQNLEPSPYAVGRKRADQRQNDAVCACGSSRIKHGAKLD